MVIKINIKVKPNSNENTIEKVEDFYFVRLKAVPEGNKANLELVKLLKRHFKAKEVRIKSGFTSRNKIVEVVV